MTALKCDRCGKLYEAYYLTEEYTKSPYRFYRIEKQMIPDNHSHYLDLCPDCQKELREWVEKSQVNAVEVVRCKDCKWASNDCEWCLNPDSPACGDDATHLYIEPNWFCADGRRKEEE